MGVSRRRGGRGTVLVLRTTAKQKCGAVPKRARIEALRLVHHSTLGSRVIKKKKEKDRAPTYPLLHLVWVRGLGLQVRGLGFWFLDLGFWVLGLKVYRSGFRVWG